MLSLCIILPGILAGGTNKGKVAMWKHVVTKPQQRKLEGQEKWDLQSPAVLEGVTQLSQIQVRSSLKGTGALMVSALYFSS